MNESGDSAQRVQACSKRVDLVLVGESSLPHESVHVPVVATIRSRPNVRNSLGGPMALARALLLTGSRPCPGAWNPVS